MTQSVVDSFTSSFSFSASSFSAFVSNSCRWSSVSWRCSCVQLSQDAGPCCDSGDFKMKDFFRKKEERKKENNQYNFILNYNICTKLMPSSAASKYNCIIIWQFAKWLWLNKLQCNLLSHNHVHSTAQDACLRLILNNIPSRSWMWYKNKNYFPNLIQLLVII